ncbi:MAG: C40 family peptidase [Burkholderiaceae bacterium]|nr:C40 family peptidase [Rhodoferax sp.]MCP5283841.1 C40 family peptidase [Burkholderiaceae bacterium]
MSAAGDLVIAALNFLDVRYHRGGSSVSDGFDCSGFTRHVVSSVLGITLPRRSAEQAQQAGLPPVARQALQPGDLVFFNTLKRTFSHVGIYIGDGRFVHAPRSGQQVRVERMDTPYWAKRFDGARRVTPPSGS